MDESVVREGKDRGMLGWIRNTGWTPEFAWLKIVHEVWGYRCVVEKYVTMSMKRCEMLSPNQVQGIDERKWEVMRDIDTRSGAHGGGPLCRVARAGERMRCQTRRRITAMMRKNGRSSLNGCVLGCRECAIGVSC